MCGSKSRAFTAETRLESACRFGWHYHPEWEILFYRNGRGTRHVGDSVEKFGPCDLVMLPARLPHAWFSSDDQTGSSSYTAIHFLPETWGDAFWNLSELASFRDLCQQAGRGLCFTGKGVLEVGERMEALVRTEVGSLDSLRDLWNIFSLLTDLGSRSLNAALAGACESRDRRLDDLLIWLESCLGDHITQRDAAARMRMSPPVFSRWFKMHTGCVFKRYLNQLRVAKVCSEIACRNMLITEAAFHAGYRNMSNFNRRFLEVTGLSPSAFRARMEQKAMRASA